MERDGSVLVGQWREKSTRRTWQALSADSRITSCRREMKRNKASAAALEAEMRAMRVHGPGFASKTTRGVVLRNKVNFRRELDADTSANEKRAYCVP